MSVRRLAGIHGFSIDRVAAAAGDDPDVLRLENLDTDLAPPTSATRATRAALDEDDANSYLPFVGRTALREAVAEHVNRYARSTRRVMSSSHAARRKGCLMPSLPSRTPAMR